MACRHKDEDTLKWSDDDASVSKRKAPPCACGGICYEPQAQSSITSGERIRGGND
jgi:hypothetical protein